MKASVSSLRAFADKVNWVNAPFLVITATLAVVLTPLYLQAEGWSWGLFALFLISGHLTKISITAGYHRFLAHRSYDAKPGVELGCLLVGAAAFQGSALGWAADHRRHHRFVDTDRDPHNIHEGFFWAHIGWLMIKEDPAVRGSMPLDLTRDRWVMWQDKYYVFIAVFMGFILPTLIGWSMGHPFGGFIFGGVLRVFATNHCTFFINSLAHYLGTKPYDARQTARDSVVMAFLACGEGYHNYHHRFASDYRNGIRWYHWDPTKWLIRGFSVLGWTSRLKRIPPIEILRARLLTEQTRLVARGVPADRVITLRERVEEAQKQWRTLREDYRRVKRSVQLRSHDRRIQMQFDVKMARLEFKRAWAQWGSFSKDWRAVPA